MMGGRRTGAWARRTAAALVALPLLGCFGAGAAQQRGKGPMESGPLEQAFAAAMKSEGSAYIAARDRIVGQGAGAVSFLEQKAADHDWRAALTAQMALAWIRERPLAEECSRLMRGQIPGKELARPITGAWPASVRGLEIAQRGKAATPRVLELLTKSREYANGTEVQALFVALGALRDARAVPPLVEVAAGRAGHADLGARVSAVEALGGIGDARASGPLQDVARRATEPLELRRAAVEALGTLEDRHAAPLLLGIAQDPHADASLRAQAAYALGNTGDAAAAAQLARSLDHESNTELLQAILTTLASIGGEAALPPVERLAARHPDEYIRSEAAHTRDAIRGRLNGGSSAPDD